MPRIFVECHDCGKRLSQFTVNPTRVEFAQTNGESIRRTCKFCGKESTYHVDEFRSSPQRWLVFAVSTAMIFVTYILARFVFDFAMNRYVLSGILMLPLLTYFISKRIIRNNSETFNSHFVSKENPED
ncbi:MAG TPA: hypothetical protein VKZ44_07120 [Taishania sp.]|nr:hypothetical protein [Taishania sp.]